MSRIFIHLQKVHDTVHDFQFITFKKLLKKKNFSQPEIFIYGSNVSYLCKFICSLNRA